MNKASNYEKDNDVISSRFNDYNGTRSKRN